MNGMEHFAELLNQIIFIMIWVCIMGCLAIGLVLLHERKQR